MPLNRRDAERSLNLLWEFFLEAKKMESAECSPEAFGPAISGLHLFLSDVLPASQPCIRAKVKGGFVEIRPREDTPVRMVDLEVAPGEKVGIVLDSIHVDSIGSLPGMSPIVISLVSPGSVAARDRRLGRGDQVLEINGHSLRLASLERARWLLDSAARKGTISMATLPYALLEGLKHSVSRHNLLTLTPTNKHKRSRSVDNITKIRKKNQAVTVPSHLEVKRSKTDVAQRFHRAGLDERYTPSIGSRSSKRSVVSTTVEMAAYLARSSVMSSKPAIFGKFKKRKVRKMHIVKGSSGLGIRIVGGKGSKYGDMGIFVNQLEEGGAANKDSRLKPGDELLMVDGKSLVGLTHAEAVEVLKTSQRLVQLVVATEDDGESVTSSVQSIPELFGGPRRKSRTAQEIAPESYKSPNRSAFEMSVYNRDDADSQPLVAETEFKKVIVKMNDSSVTQNQVIEMADSEPTSPVILPPDPPIKTIVYIKTGGKSLGFSVCGGVGSKGGDMGILIRNIDPNGLAAQDGRLKKGDEILEVNSQPLKQRTHKEAANIIRSIKSEVITIVVRSRAHVKRTSSVRGTELEVVLDKLPGKPLGIQLTEVLEGDKLAVFVKKMAPGSVAEQSGQIQLYDQIVSVNDKSVIGLKGVEVKGMLTAAPAGELRVGLVKPRDRTAIEKLITEQEQHKKSKSSPVNNDNTTPLPAVNVLFDREDSLSGSELDDEEKMEVYVARSSFSAHKLPQNNEPSPLVEHTTRRNGHFIASSNSSSPPSRASPLTRPSLATQLTPPLGFIQLEITFKKRPKSGLGITIVACTGTTQDFFMVRRIVSGGVAAKDAQLRAGDRIVCVNNVLLKGLSHAEVLQKINDAPKNCLLVIWRDPNYSAESLISSLAGSRTSLISTDEEPKRIKRKLSSHEHSPIDTLKRFSLDGRNQPSPSYNRHSLVVASKGESPLRFKRWSTAEGVQADIDTSSLDRFFPLDSEDAGNKSSGSATPVPTPPEAYPPSLPEAPLPSPNEDTEVPSTPPPSTLPTDFPLLEKSVSIETMKPPQLPTSLPPEIGLDEENTIPADDQPQLPLSLPPDDEQETKQEVTMPGATYDESLLPPTSPPLDDALPPTEDEPQLPSTLPPTDEDEEAPNVPSSLPPEVPPEEPSPPSSPPPEEDQNVSDTHSTERLPDTPPPEVPSLPPSDDIHIEDTNETPPLPNLPPPELEAEHATESTSEISQGVRQEAGPFEICLYKSMFGLGIQLISDAMGMPAIKKIATWSAMAKDKNIRVGDHILSVNDTSFIGKPLAECEAFLKKLPKGQVKFVAMAPPKDVTGNGFNNEPESSVYTGVAVSESGRQLVTEEGVVSTKLFCCDNQPLGIEIEGGTDTPLQYVYITRLIPGSPAFESGVFRKGDQLVVVGDDCIIGLTHKETLDILKKASATTVEIVAQRKESPKQARKPASMSDIIDSDSKEEDILNETVERKQESPEQKPSPPVSPIPILLTPDSEATPISLTEVCAKPELQGDSDSSTEDLPQIPSHKRPLTIKQLSVDADKDVTLQVKKPQSTGASSSENSGKKDTDSAVTRQDVAATVGTNIVPEETFTIELHRTANEKLGLGISGGVDNPRLQEVHVKQVVANCVAHKDGRLKRGDRIVTVNGQCLSGLANREALKLLKEAGLDVTLVIARKIGRRTSTMASPYISTIHSKRGSGEHSQQSSTGGSKQSSPHTSRKRKLSSGENSRNGSKGSSPKPSIRRHSRKPSTATLPRQLSSTIGVKVVELQKGPTGMGMQLQGGKEGTNVPITVKSVFPGGAAYKSAKIRTGDVILEANGISFEEMSHDQAISTMKGFPQGKVSLILRDRTAAGH